ncbi:MAG: peptidoglycan-binding protein [Archangium sp.]|nr:peptidoglycan-binding protein [Archangium sp.]
MPVRSISPVRSGSTGNDVKELQRALVAKGFDPQGTDGKFGENTRKAVVAFQKANGLKADGVVGKDTRAALFGAAPPSTPVRPREPVDGFEGEQFKARGTGYYPDSSAMEGGYVDRKGAKLNTLQDFLSGKAPYVSVAMDSKAFPYGTKLRIPELEAKYGKQIEFRVVDTGGAFKGKGTSRIDVCTANRRASLDPTINGPLTLVRG